MHKERIPFEQVALGLQKMKARSAQLFAESSSAAANRDGATHTRTGLKAAIRVGQGDNI